MKLSKSSPLQTIIDTLPQVGKVVWVGIRPEKRKAMKVMEIAEAIEDKGLLGDHYTGKSGSKRQITLIQLEHLNSVASYLNVKNIDPGLTRRNIVTSGINLLAFKDKTFEIGEALLQYTGECHPCSRMEANLGLGGYNAMRGHGGITARIIRGGLIKSGDLVKVYSS